MNTANENETTSLRRRARSDGQKEARRQDILDVAWAMFQQRPYREIAMRDVAAAAGLAKGTLYLYFQTKEELFLAVEEQQLGEWFARVNAALAEVRGAEQVAQLISDSLTARPYMVRLHAMLYAILEQNIEYAAAQRYKEMLLAETLRTGTALERALPFLPLSEGAHIVLLIHAMVVGIAQMADPAPIAAQVMEEPTLAIFKVDFATEFLYTLTALLRGLEYKREESKYDEQG